MIVVYTTCKDEEEAKSLARKLLDLRLVACANFFPIKSMYWWNSELQEDAEFAVIFKSRKELFEQVKTEIESMHSYDIPLVECLEVSNVNSVYWKWMLGEMVK